MPLIAQLQDLDRLDVLFESNNNYDYFDVAGLPAKLTFGKHYFTLTFKDPPSGPLLVEDSQILFEFKDARGNTILSDITNLNDINGAAVCYVWVKQNPALTAADIADGPGQLIICGQIETDDESYKGRTNYRATFDIDIRKSLPNTSPILFQSASLIQSNFSVSESVELDSDNNDKYNRSYLTVSASHLDTYGGQVRFIELAYKEQKARSNRFRLITDYEITGSPYEVDPVDAAGLTPISDTFKLQLPREIRRNKAVQFRLRFKNSAGEVAKDLTRNNIPVKVTSSFTTILGTPLTIEREDNLLSGSMFTGRAVGKGFETSGKRSAFIKTVDYTGFVSASAGTGKPGVLFFSGSVLSGSGDNYEGVGFELHGGVGSSSFKFRSDPSELDIRADKFFVGSTTTQFVSGSDGNIEISSSAFHLDPANNILVISGTIQANAGNIGNFEIIDGLISGSNITMDALRSQIYKTDQGPGSDTGAVLDRLRDEYYIDFTPSQSTAPGDPTGTEFYIKMGPNFMVDKQGVLIASGAKFVGTITASAGTIGGFTIATSSLFSDSIFISGSPAAGGANLDKHKFISTTNFNVKQNGDITGSQVLFSGGQIGGFTLSNNSISSSNNALRLKDSGQITGSTVLFTGGKIGGFLITTSSIVNTANTVELNTLTPGLNIKDSGGTDRVTIKSGSFQTIGGGQQYVENKSFENTSSNFSGRSFAPTIPSWSYSTTGGTQIALTDRAAYPDEDKAVSGDITLDVVVLSGANNYSESNQYNIVQDVTGSFSQGDTLSFSSVARFSSSFGGRGKDRALGPQYFRLMYSSSTSNGFVTFLPGNDFTSSNGFGEYFLGSGQYNSFGASAELPQAASFVRVELSGSVNDDTGFEIEKNLYANAKAGTVPAELKSKKFISRVTGSTTAENPETEITFDNFSLRSNQRKVEVTDKGILIYNSEDSFFKMTSEGIELRGGSGVSTFGQSISRETFTNDSQIAGTLAAPSLQGYESDPEDIALTAFDGNVAEYAKGNHRHRLTFSPIDSLLGANTVTSMSVSTFDAGSISGSITGSVNVLGNVSGSMTSTGSFGNGFFAGNLSIGSSVTNSTINVYSPSNTQIQFQDNATGTGAGDGVRVGWNGTVGQFFIFENAGFRIATNNTERIVIGADGTVGIGVTPETDFRTSNVQGLQVGAGGAIFARKDAGETKIFIAENVKWTSDGFEHINNGPAAYHGMDAGIHSFVVAPSGTADAVISETLALSIANSGDVTFPVANQKISGSLTSTGSFGALAIGTSTIEADINFQPDVYTTGGQGIRWQDAVVTTDAIIQGVRQASNVGIGVFIGANSQVDTSGGISRFNTGEESSFISVDPRGDLYFGTGGTGANPSTRLYINSSGNVGIGTTSPDGTLHVHTATAGTMTAHVSADDLVVEKDDHGGISILTPNNRTGAIYFGDVEDNNIGALHYNHALNKLILTVAAADRFSLSSNTAEFASTVSRISGSLISTASFGSIKVGNLDHTHHLTGSVEISGSFLVNGGGVATTPGNNTEVIFNDGGSLGSEASFTYDKTKNHLSASAASTASFGLLLQNGEGVASVGGADTNVLINTGGVISGSGDFVFDNLKISGSLTSTGSFGSVVAADNIAIGTTTGISDQGAKLHIFEDDSSFGSTTIHVENAKSDDAAIIVLEGARTSENDTGQLVFRNSNDNVAAIKAYSGHSSNNDSGELRFFVSADGSGDVVSTAMTIDTNQRVGIGTTSPSGPLHVFSSDPLSVELESSTGNVDLTINSGTDGAVEKSSIIFQANSSATWEILKTNSGDFMVYDYGRSASVIDIGANSNMSLMANGGNVGIGTSSPATKLHVSASVTASTQDIVIIDNTVKNRKLHLGLTEGNSSIQAKLNNGTTNKLFLQPSGSVTEFGGNISGSINTTASFYDSKIVGKLAIGGQELSSKALHVDGEVRFDLGGSSVIDFSTVGGDGAMYISDSDGTVKVNFDSEGVSYFNGGNVGIGTATPANPLHVYHGTTNGVALFESGDAQGGIALKDNSTSANVFLLATGNNFGIQTGGVANRVTVLSDGKVGIGTANPTNLLELSASDSGDALLDIHNTHATNGYGMRVSAGDDNNVYSARFQSVSAAALMTVWGGGNVSVGPQDSAKTHLDVQSYQADGITIGADNDANRTRTNSTTKTGGITGVHYTNAEESIRLLGYSSLSNANIINIGGGNSDWNAATKIDFYTAANFNTTSGTKTLTIAPNTISGSLISTSSFGAGIYSGQVTLNRGGGDFYSGSTLAAYTPGAAENAALYLNGGGNGDALHIEAGNNAYASNQYVIKTFDQNTKNVVFGVVKANTAEADDCYNMDISGLITIGKETNHNSRFTTSSWSRYIIIDAENSGGGGIVWSQQSTSKVTGILSNHGQLEIGYSTSDDASAAWVPGIILDASNDITISGNISGSLSKTGSFSSIKTSRDIQIENNAASAKLEFKRTVSATSNYILQAYSGVFELFDLADSREIWRAKDDGTFAIAQNTTVAGNVSASLGSTGSFDHIIAQDKIRIQNNVADTQKLIFADENVGIQRAQGATRTNNGNSLYLSAFEDIIFTAQATTMASQGERMRITEEGNVGIATSTPSRALHVKSLDTGYVELRLEGGSSGGSSIEFYSGSVGLADIYADTDKALNIRTGGTTHAVTIDESQNVGIGTTAPATKLHIIGNVGGPGEGIRIERSGFSSQYMTIDSDSINTNSGELRFQNDSGGDIVIGGSITGSLSSTGSFGSLVTAGLITTPGNVQVGTAGSNNFVYSLGNLTLQAASGYDLMLDAGAGADELTLTTTSLTSTVPIIVDGNVSGSATSTGSFGHGYIDSQLGIGTVSPTAPIHIQHSALSGFDSHADDLLVIERTGGVTSINMAVDTDQTSYLMFSDTTRHMGSIAYFHSGDTMQFRAGATTVADLTSTTFQPASDDAISLGTASKRWSDVHAVQTTTGGVFETGLRTKKIGDNQTGTIVSWTKDGLVPCNKNEDELVMGVIKQGKDEPIVLGAEPVLITGKIDMGDYIVTSNKVGHGKAIKKGYLLKKDLFGKVIAQALESGSGDSYTIKAMIRKM